MKFVKSTIYWVPFILYMALIFYLSSIPQPPMPMSDVWNIDKVYHLIEYSIFSLLAFYAFVHAPFKIISENAILLAILFTAFFGATDEIHQLYVEGRQSNITDWLFDTAGGFLGVFCALLLRRLYQSWIFSRESDVKKKDRNI
mgnify:CR=1 FL=1